MLGKQCILRVTAGEAGGRWECCSSCPFDSRLVSLCSLPKPAAASEPARTLPGASVDNKHDSNVLCVDNISCIWTSGTALRQALKPVAGYLEVSTLTLAALCFLLLWLAIGKVSPLKPHPLNGYRR